MLNLDWNKTGDGNICLKYMTKEEFNSLNSLTRTNIRLIIQALDFVLEKLESDEITEITVNSDGKVFAHGLLGEKNKALLGIVRPDGLSENEVSNENGLLYIDGIDTQVATKTLATYYDTQVHELNPLLSVEIPFLGHRFSAIMKPCSTNTSISIRSKAKKIFTLEDYVKDKMLTVSQMKSLKEMISARRNILVVGGTGSGKTTFCNALLHAMSELDFDSRVIIIEDVRELQCNVNDKENWLIPPIPVKEQKSGFCITAETLLRHAMRSTPDRIVVGEIRDGAAANVLLMAWNSGHSGGITTIHADDARGGLRKLEQYLEMDGKKPNPAAIAKTIHCVVSIQKATQIDENDKLYRIRKVEEIVAVNDYLIDLKEYDISSL